MKYARKMALVDVNSTKTQDADPLVKAINSLASATEFGRDYYGSNTSAIVHLDKELKQILERADINPTEKLQLYSQTLNRYLFLHRMSENKTHTTNQPTPGPIILEHNHTLPNVQSQGDFSSERESETDQSFTTVVSSSPVTPKNKPVQRTPVTTKHQPVQHSPRYHPVQHTPTSSKSQSESSKTPKEAYEEKRGHKSNIPRTTPKSEILREKKDRRPVKYGEYFTNWGRKPE